MENLTPGNTTDLNETELLLWKKELNALFNYGVKVAQNETIPVSEKSWFFNPIKDGTQNTVTTDIKWNAFPKRLKDNSSGNFNAWRKGDKSRQNQEEYCEWEVVRNGNSVVKVTFTTETPDYYSFLFENSPNTLLSLYHKHVSSNVKIEDLVLSGKYNPKNKWNYPEIIGAKGVLMHMGFDPNTLGAAINLSAEATWPSIDSSGNLITDEQGLIECRDFGAAARHSDPHIGARINALTRAGNEVSFAAPSGLYIDSVDFSRFKFPENYKSKDFFKLVRGDESHMMRVIFEAPKNSGLSLSDVKIDGEKILFGSQIAETVTIRIRGIARNIDNTPPSIDCSGQAQEGFNNIETFSLIGTRKQSVTYMSSSE